MGKVLFAIVAVLASFVAVESLTCNTCPFSVLGYCVKTSTVNCTSLTTNFTRCLTTRLTFPDVTNFTAFTTHTCALSNDTCADVNDNFLGARYTFKTECCNTDRCNTISVNGATTTKMTFTAAIGGAILASVWGSML